MNLNRTLDFRIKTSNINHQLDEVYLPVYARFIQHNNTHIHNFTVSKDLNSIGSTFSHIKKIQIRLNSLHKICKQWPISVLFNLNPIQTHTHTQRLCKWNTKIYLNVKLMWEGQKECGSPCLDDWLCCLLSVTDEDIIIIIVSMELNVI